MAAVLAIGAARVIIVPPSIHQADKQPKVGAKRMNKNGTTWLKNDMKKKRVIEMQFLHYHHSKFVTKKLQACTKTLNIYETYSYSHFSIYDHMVFVLEDWRFFWLSIETVDRTSSISN